MQTQTKTRTTWLAFCGLFAALATICSWISIPLGFTPVPMNLATLAVFLAGGLLGPKYGPLSLSVYALAGAVGVPVFAGFRGGISVLAGPTGGFVAGYIAAAFVAGLICRKGNLNTARIAFAYILSLAVCYGLGIIWFMASTGTGAGAALVSCVIPFLPGDAIKITAAVILTKKLQRHL